MKPYHPANFELQPYAPWRVIVLAWAGKILGVQFHIYGIPFGATKHFIRFAEFEPSKSPYKAPDPNC